MLMNEMMNFVSEMLLIFMVNLYYHEPNANLQNKACAFFGLTFLVSKFPEISLKFSVLRVLYLIRCKLRDVNDAIKFKKRASS